MNLVQAFKAESAYDHDLLEYRKNADRVMFGMNCFLTLVCFAVAPYRNTWLSCLLISLPTLLLAYFLMRQMAGALITRLFMACAFMAYTSLIIHQSGGDIEAHFSAFGLIGVLLYYRDWRTICAATVFIYLQHMLAGYAQTVGVGVYVFDTPDFWTVLPLHVAYFLPFVGMMGFLSIWLRKEGHEQNRLIQEGLVRERELQDLMVKSEVANRLKSEILANMSHEIRTPLNGIGGMIQLLMKSELTSSQRDLLATARDASDHLLSVINNILDFSKIESGAFELKMVPFDVRELLEEMQLFFRSSAANKQLQLELTCDVNVPKKLMIDPVALRQVLMNLISNAIKFTQKGGVFIRCNAQCIDPTNLVTLSIQVQDTGIGFDVDQAESLFAPFVQADNTSTRMYGGTGLGLPITRGLVQRMGGSIDALGTLGQGALFTVKLPCQIPIQTHQSVTLPAPKETIEHRNRLDVLLVEDHLINQKVMTLILQRLGHRVTVVENGRIALDCLQTRSFDLILLDVMMPVMDGPQMLQVLREMEQREGGHQCVIIVTAHATTGDKELFLEMGADGYLAKPIQINELGAEIVRVMNACVASQN